MESFGEYNKEPREEVLNLRLSREVLAGLHEQLQHFQAKLEVAQRDGSNDEIRNDITGQIQELRTRIQDIETNMQDAPDIEEHPLN